MQLQKGQRIEVVKPVVAYYFGGEELEVFSVDGSFIVLLTAFSDFPGLIGVQDEFTQSQIDKLFGGGFFQLKTDNH